MQTPDFRDLQQVHPTVRKQPKQCELCRFVVVLLCWWFGVGPELQTPPVIPGVSSWEIIAAHPAAPESCHIFVLFMTRLASEGDHLFVPCHNLSQRLFPIVSFCVWTLCDLRPSCLSLSGVFVFWSDSCYETWRCEDTPLSVRRTVVAALCSPLRIRESEEALPDVTVAPGCDRRDEEPPAPL